MRIGSINPIKGPVEGGTTVTILGELLPARAAVTFGDIPAYVSSNTPEVIIVETGPSLAGLVPVTVTDVVTGESVTLADAFTYIGEGPTVSTSSTTTTTPQTTTTLVGEITTTTVAGTTTTTEGTTTTTPSDAGQSMAEWLDGVLVTPDVELAPLDPSDPYADLLAGTWATELCDEPECPGWVLREGVDR
jgi:hypothetical protein